MFTSKDIIKEGNPSLKRVASSVTIPVSLQDKEILKKLLSYVLESQNPDKEDKTSRSAVGLAAPQVNISKQMFAIITHDLEGLLHVIAVANPKIVKKSKIMTYLPSGEGCLSVDRTTEGLTPRYKEITLEGLFLNLEKDRFEKKRQTYKDYIAIVIQHEYDHLQGILYTDKLFKELPELQPLYAEEVNPS